MMLLAFQFIGYLAKVSTHLEESGKNPAGLLVSTGVHNIQTSSLPYPNRRL